MAGKKIKLVGPKDVDRIIHTNGVSYTLRDGKVTPDFEEGQVPDHVHALGFYNAEAAAEQEKAEAAAKAKAKGPQA